MVLMSLQVKYVVITAFISLYLNITRHAYQYFLTFCLEFGTNLSRTWCGKIVA